MFNVLAFGARPDGATDSAPMIQRAIDVAQAAAGPTGGAVVYVPGGPKPYLVGAPLLVKGRGLTVRGDGPGTVFACAAGYAGPLLCVGLPAGAGTIGSAYRPDAFGLLDPSAAPERGARRGVSTLGRAALLFQAHPLQLGGPNPKYDFRPPDYWVDAPRLTLEFFLARPRGATWKQGDPILGMSRNNMPAPWQVMVGANPEELWLLFKSDEPRHQDGPEFYRVVVPLGPGPGPWRVTIQLDLAEGRHAAWVNRRRVATGAGAHGPIIPAMRPGLAFQPHDGATPFLVGSAGKTGPSGKGKVTPLTLYGLRVSKNALYRWDASIETPVSSRGPLRDADRYFAMTPETVSLLRLDDPPGPPAVRTAQDRGSALGYWVPNDRVRDTQHVSVRDLVLRASLMPGLVVGEHLGLRLERVESMGGLQGVGTVPLATSYPMTMNDCILSGYDCGFFSFWQNIAAHNTMVNAFGRNALRFRSGYCLFDHTFVGPFAANTETAVEILGDDSGPTFEFRRLLVDNEGGGPKRAIIEIEQGSYNPQNRLVVDGLDISHIDPNAAILRLIGHGSKGIWSRGKLDARNITVWRNEYRAAVELVGPPGWHGTFDGSSLPHAKVLGTGADKIRVTPPAEFP
jgi:hypothetical protein